MAPRNMILQEEDKAIKRVGVCPETRRLFKKYAYCVLPGFSCRLQRGAMLERGTRRIFLPGFSPRNERLRFEVTTLTAPVDLSAFLSNLKPPEQADTS